MMSLQENISQRFHGHVAQQEKIAQAQVEAAKQEPNPDELHLTLCDALAGWKYIREQHGDSYGVGWDRVQSRLETQITASAKRLKALAEPSATEQESE